MTTVLVTGACGPAGRALVEQLVARRVRVVGCDAHPDGPGARAAAPVHRVPLAGSPAFLAALARLARDAGADLVIPTVSEELVVLATAPAAVPGDGGPLPPVVVGAPGAVRAADDKWTTAQLLDRARVPAPRTVLGGALGEQGDLVQRLGWPYLSKPRTGRGCRGVVVHRPDDLDAPAAFPPSVVLQEFVPGAEYAVDVHLGGAGGDGREPGDVAVVLRKAHLTHGEVGNATSVVRVDAPEVAALGLAAVRALGLTGPADVDVRRRADGVPVVLEVNARFGAHSAHAPEVLAAVLRSARWAPPEARAAVSGVAG